MKLPPFYANSSPLCGSRDQIVHVGSSWLLVLIDYHCRYLVRWKQELQCTNEKSHEQLVYKCIGMTESWQIPFAIGMPQTKSKTFKNY